jgi:putative CocE/NonD family hydrolase
MKKLKLFAGLLGLIGVGSWMAYRNRRRLFAAWLKLGPSRFEVVVQRAIPVRMPDGVDLLTDHFYPHVPGSFPTILIRTPYGRRDEAGFIAMMMTDFPAQRFAERGYHVLVQGVRGCFDSGGEFSPHLNEAADGKVTVDWITKQPWFNGSLATWGSSYLGYCQWAIAVQAPEGLKAIQPSITASQNYVVSFPDDAFGLETRLRWAQGMALRALNDESREQSFWSGLAEGNKLEKDLQAAFYHLPLGESDLIAVGEPVAFYRELLNHQHSDDEYWQKRDHSSGVAQLNIPVHLLGGWYDYYLRGLLEDYARLKSSGKQPYLTIGPWSHPSLEPFLESLRTGMAWFDAHLKDDASRLRDKPVSIYVMGANEWRQMDEWPPDAESVHYYLQPGGQLMDSLPDIDSASRSYRYDPTNPTPVLGGAILDPKLAGPQNNQVLENRSDVLTYTTRPLEEPLEVIGPVSLELYVSSSLEYTDFFGRLCDIHPNGHSINVCDGLFRIKPGKGELMGDGGLSIHIDLSATAYRFQPGHSVRLQVSSGAHPRWSRNLGSNEPYGSGMIMRVADQTVYHDRMHPSALVLPIISEK